MQYQLGKTAKRSVFFAIVAIAVLSSLYMGMNRSVSAAEPPTVRYALTFSLLDEVSVGALQYVVHYTAPGRFVGDRNDVACESLLDEPVRATFKNDSHSSALRSGWYSPVGFDGPVDLAECIFEARAGQAVFSQQFVVEVKLISALSASGGHPFPRVTVTKVRQGAGPQDRIVGRGVGTPAG